ncbi:MAG TPA: galactonate dehydratase [Thermomicrobiales bacterium]|nr:galactonate dehydratase [Thermomicrobiales bacterium]
MAHPSKITGVRTVAVGAGWRNYVYVLLDTSDGISGLGEASLGGQTNAVLGALKDLEPLLLGADPARIEHIWQQAYRHAFWHGGVTFLSALAGVEVALWDIKGKTLGVPIHRMLGGPVRDRIRAYANGPRGETPDELANSAADLVRRGFAAMKMAPFEATPMLAGKRVVDAGVAKVRAVREAVGPEVELMIDAHGRLSPAAAARAAEALAPFGIMFFEEPTLPEHAPSLTRLARKSPIPIAVGERHYTRWDYPELLASRTIGVLQPDIIQTGGLAEARKIAALAEMHFVAVAPHNPWSWVNTVASLHLDAVTPNFLIQEVITDAEPWKDEVVVGRPAIDAGGYFGVPVSPGLGIELDLDAARRFPPVEGRPPALWHDDGAVADW